MKLCYTSKALSPTILINDKLISIIIYNTVKRSSIRYILDNEFRITIRSLVIILIYTKVYFLHFVINFNDSKKQCASMPNSGASRLVVPHIVIGWIFLMFGNQNSITEIIILLL